MVRRREDDLMLVIKTISLAEGKTSGLFDTQELNVPKESRKVPVEAWLMVGKSLIQRPAYRARGA